MLSDTSQTDGAKLHHPQGDLEGSREANGQNLPNCRHRVSGILHLVTLHR